MNNNTILITGGAGFIGSHLVEHMLNHHLGYNIINLDDLTYAGDLNRLKFVEDKANYTFVKGNICDVELIAKIFSTYNIKGIIHLAAESHVDNSISDPKIFVRTNIQGTFNLLEAARKYWADNNKVEHRFLHVSTDEVYGSLGSEGYFSETTAYAPNSPYSASKAASDFLVRSYFHTYNLPVVISNCSNNYGSRQHEEKFIPTVIRQALKGKAIPIYGEGKNIRDWLYVKDHCLALDVIFHQGKLGDSYNIGTHNERANIEIATLICNILAKLKPLPKGSSYLSQISYVKDRVGHDFRYAIDNSKLCLELNWQPSFTFMDSLTETIEWYIKYYNYE